MDFSEEFVVQNKNNIFNVGLGYFTAFVFSPAMALGGLYMLWKGLSSGNSIMASIIVCLILVGGAYLLFTFMFRIAKEGKASLKYDYLFKVGKQGITIGEMIYSWQDINMNLDDKSLLEKYIYYNDNIATIIYREMYKPKCKELTFIEFTTKSGQVVRLNTSPIKAAFIPPYEKTPYSNNERADFMDKNYDNVFYPRMLKYLRAGLDGMLN